MKRRRPEPKKKPKRSLRLPMLLLAGATLAALLMVAIYAIWAATYDMDGVKQIPERSSVYDMDGKFYSRLHGENRIKVEKYSNVATHFVDALLAREDSRFHKHNGVDPIGIVRAIGRNITHLSVKEGASTLTQQLARNSFPLGGQTLHRKLLEAFVALRIERNLSKEEILLLYMNRIYFGSGLWGVETASQAYFGKASGKLSLGESAMLVGIIRSPNRFSPFNNFKGAIVQRDTVLDRMVKLEMITETEAASAKKAKVSVNKRRPVVTQENYAMDAVTRDLSLLLDEDQRDTGGMRIYTTIDPALQKAAGEAVEKHLSAIEKKPGFAHPKKGSFSADSKAEEAPTDYLQGAVVVLDNRSGGIRALIGGRDFSESKFNRALMAKRQVGSTFKPFVYAAAFSQGLLPRTTISDGRIGKGELRTAGNWSPGNSDNTYGGLLPAEEGLIQSRNTMSVRIGDMAGIKNVTQLAKSAGLGELPRGPAIFLGSFEATLKDVTQAYSVFPNNGERKQPYIVERIDDEFGNVIYRAAHISAPVADPGVSWLVTDALTKVFTKGTAATANRLGFKKPAAGKTGTTNEYKDAWFVGYTTALTCGVWVGLDSPAPIAAKGYGSVLALPIWTQVMKAASSSRYPAQKFKPPVPLVHAEICAVSSARATTGCASSGSAYGSELPSNLVPRDLCRAHQGRVLADRRESGNRSSSSRRRNVIDNLRSFFRR